MTFVCSAIVILAGTESLPDFGRLVNGLEAANEFSEADCSEVELMYKNSGT